MKKNPIFAHVHRFKKDWAAKNREWQVSSKVENNVLHGKLFEFYEIIYGCMFSFAIESK